MMISSMRVRRRLSIGPSTEALGMSLALGTSMRQRIGTLLCGCLVVGLLAGGTTSVQDGHGSIVGWGSQVVGRDLSAGFAAVAGGWYHNLGLKADGSIMAWGFNSSGQCDVPVPNTDFVAVTGGWEHSLGLKNNGSIMAWGWNAIGQCDVPAPNADFVTLAGGGDYGLGIRGYPRGDTDADLDVDLDDFAVFVDCLDGPDVMSPIECDATNLDHDGDTDLGDFAVFQTVFTGSRP